ncbi:MAG: zinc-dependent metalloprotease [Phycisphaerales bacterium]|nr:zinc-dependent metalloprotease [Phycisphaerales bacterium]
MIKKVLFTLSFASMFGMSAQAQTTQPCGTDEVRREILVLHPEILDKEAKLNQQIAEKIAAMSKKDLSPFAKTTDGGSTVAYDIPIVFHIIHDYGDEYVTDAQIIASVAKINTMYNKTNADTADVIAPFKGFINNSKTRYIGNARITWHLASKDPNGNPTNGITRRRNYITKNAGDLAKYDQWPPSSYMNVWIINKFSKAHVGAAAYAYKPATADALPYYDGPIGLYGPIAGIDYDYTYTHELGHELNLDHPWGSTNNPKIACGDDDVDDTPLTKGHDPKDLCSDLLEIYDTACLFTRNKPMGKLRIDTFRRADSPAYTPVIFADTSTSKGISFQCRTASSLDTFKFYPSAPIGSTYKIGLKRGSVIIDSVTVISTVTKEAQFVKHRFKLPITDTNTLFKLYFMQNPGAMRDTVTPGFSIYPRGVAGTVLFKNYITDSFYNFFYDWKVSYGFFKMYGDSLVDYPDTTNSQNVMDYTYCSKMFTAGQVERMRATLALSVAHRDSLVSPFNLKKTGALDTVVLKPKAEYSVEKAVLAPAGVISTSNTPSYFLCSESASNYVFKFRDRTWQAAPTSTSWDLSNGATLVSSVNGYKFSTPGWATIKLIASNTVGSDTFIANPGIYVADPTQKPPIGYWQEFTDATENAKWPIFNYYNNRYKWEIGNFGGTYDASCIRYRSYDDRTYPDNLLGDASGDYDDFFSPAFDLSSLDSNGNLNFMYAGAYATTNPDYIKDTLEIAYSNTCGATWTVLKTMKNGEMQTVGTIPTVAREYTPAWNEWKPMSIDLKNGSTLVRDSRVFFRFRYKPSSRPLGNAMYASGNNFYLDRINISNNPLSVNEMILGDRKATVAPNPTNANAFVLFQKPNARVSIQVTDITGKLVYSVTEKVDQNNARIEIPASYLGAKGVYLVHITGDDNLNQTEKLIVY